MSSKIIILSNISFFQIVIDGYLSWKYGNKIDEKGKKLKSQSKSIKRKLEKKGKKLNVLEQKTE